MTPTALRGRLMTIAEVAERSHLAELTRLALEALVDLEAIEQNHGADMTETTQEFTLWAQPGRPVLIRVCGLLGDERAVRLTVSPDGMIGGSIEPRAEGGKVERGR